MKDTDEFTDKLNMRKKKAFNIFLIILSIVLFSASLVLIYLYNKINKKYTILYDQSAKIDYAFELEDNDFYKTNYIEEDIDVISDLIKNINVKFDYKLNLSKETEYTYNYKIVKNMRIKDKSKTNLIYNNEEITTEKEPLMSNEEKFELSDNFTIDYKTYNEIIKNLIEQYKLDNTESEVEFNVYLDVKNNATGESITQGNILGITVPLNTKTVEIEVNNNINTKQGKLIKERPKNINYYLISGLVMLIGGIFTLIKLRKSNLQLRSPEEIYNSELKKILFDYKSFVQEISTKIDYNSYQIIKVPTFSDLLGIRQDVQLPILMYKVKNSRTTAFMIIKDKMIFVYTLGVQIPEEKLLDEGKHVKG